MPPKNKKQHDLILILGSGKKGIGGLNKDPIKEFVKKTPKRRGLFSKGKD
jgi:hypothetical protein